MADTLNLSQVDPTGVGNWLQDQMKQQEGKILTSYERTDGSYGFQVRSDKAPDKAFEVQIRKVTIKDQPSQS